MGFLSSIISLTSARQLNQHAETIAQASWPFVWQRVKGRILSMTPAEARGYIRAHGAPIICANVNATIRDADNVLGEWAREALVERVTDHIIWMAIDEVVQIRRQTERKRAA